MNQTVKKHSGGALDIIYSNSAFKYVFYKIINISSNLSLEISSNMKKHHHVTLCNTRLKIIYTPFKYTTYVNCNSTRLRQHGKDKSFKTVGRFESELIRTVYSKVLNTFLQCFRLFPNVLLSSLIKPDKWSFCSGHKSQWVSLMVSIAWWSSAIFYFSLKQPALKLSLEVMFSESELRVRLQKWESFCL